MKAGLIGHGIGGSLTPAMHEAEGAALGLVGYSYTRFDTSQAPFCQLTLPEMIQSAEENGFAGLNITHPFKTEVLYWVDALSPAARAIGAANTVVFEHGRRVAYNTDHPGFRRAFESLGATLPRREVLMLGAGGAGPAVGMALLDAGVESLDIVDPVPRKALGVAKRLAQVHAGRRIRALETADGLDLSGFDGVVNATPVGMAGHPGMPLDPTRLVANAWVADIVYFPRETEFLRVARARGMPTLPGTGMALYQAVEAFELITGQVPDAARMAASLDAMLRGMAPLSKEAGVQ